MAFEAQASALKFITCGSVDDGKSTLIGRLLVDSKAVLQDQLAGVQRQGSTDLALLTDGLSAEREQGITIDVAYRYFATEQRKFIIGDAPGHEQYTRNMVTAASSADAAVALVDAIKLDWQKPDLQLLPQTRRHALLLQLLRVPTVLFVINKLDAVADAQLAYDNIRAALHTFTQGAGIDCHAVLPISALQGWNVVDSQDGWCGYSGPSLLKLLEQLPTERPETALPLAFPVQWVEKCHDSATTAQGRRIFWGRVATGNVRPGQTVAVFPSGQTAQVAQVLGATRQVLYEAAGQSAGLVLDREIDVSRGDWLLALTNTAEPQREIDVTVAWMDDAPLQSGRLYWVLHGHRWVKAKVLRIQHRLNIHSLAQEPCDDLPANAIGRITLGLQEPLFTRPFSKSKSLGALILVDTASHRTAGAGMVL